jgi:hypothetical protein
MSMPIEITEQTAESLIATARQAGIRNETRARLGRKSTLHIVQTDRMIIQLLRVQDKCILRLRSVDEPEEAAN